MGSITETNGLDTDLARLKGLLETDTKVKVAGVDADGLLRGKIISKEKFMSVAESGFGFSSAVFGWDMHDVLYTKPTSVTSEDIGYPDFIAVPDLKTFRRIPWENNTPFFLLRFLVGKNPVSACGRSILKKVSNKLAQVGLEARAGVELEFVNFQTPTMDGYTSSAPTGRQNVAAFLEHHSPSQLRTLSNGMFGYSLTRISASKAYFMDIFDTSLAFGCQIEGWHTESGAGVFEAALAVTSVDEMADRVTLFKYLAKAVGVEHGNTPCFMAKPIYGASGSSGHIHISMATSNGENIFVRETEDVKAEWSDIRWLSDYGRHFLAGILDALNDIMILLAPTVNSYKRLVENYWAPVDISWGLEDRRASIRLIAPPTCKPNATRFEIRIPGADMQPYYALSALVGAGLRGVEKKLPIPISPISAMKQHGQIPERLPNSLEAALASFRAPHSIAREMFGDEFVDFFAESREHELRCWREAVTDWEVRRYIETI